jgi:hypothetical protein
LSEKVIVAMKLFEKWTFPSKGYRYSLQRILSAILPESEMSYRESLDTQVFLDARDTCVAAALPNPSQSLSKLPKIIEGKRAKTLG